MFIVRTSEGPKVFNSDDMFYALINSDQGVLNSTCRCPEHCVNETDDIINERLFNTMIAVEFKQSSFVST